MVQIYENPPNYKEIVKRFPKVASLPVLFAWGTDIYNPRRVMLSAALEAHETAHGARQLQMDGGVEEWWMWYLESTKFRLKEETFAHRIEYLVLVGEGSNRHERRKAFKRTAVRLNNSMYDFGMTNSQMLQQLRDVDLNGGTP